MRAAGLWLFVVIWISVSNARSVFPENNEFQRLKRGQEIKQPASKKSPKQTAVAFHAKLRGSAAGSSGTKVKYDKVLLNEGRGFDLLHHVFKAANAGVYMFHVEACTTSSGGCVDLRHNHDLVKTGRAHSAYSRIAIHAPLKLKKDDFVYVRFCKSMTLTSSYDMNSFAGYLISK